MHETIIVLPSARAIRHEQLHIKNQTLFLPNYITMSEFINKLCIVEDFKIADDDSRILLLLEASDFNAFSKLQIERNFFTFTKNSTYIFKFFEEFWVVSLFSKVNVIEYFPNSFRIKFRNELIGFF